MRFVIGIFGVIQGLLQIGTSSATINWQSGNWAFACDFPGSDLSNAQIPGDQCGGNCAATQGCTHFTWTTYNGGTCWKKHGSVTKADAIVTSDNSMVCGIVGAGINWQSGNQVNWAVACDFSGNDLSSVQIPGDQCGGKCAATQGCTHFTWTTYNGGTCWKKYGSVTKSNAIAASDNSMICGIVEVADSNGGQRNLEFKNNCNEPVWVASQGSPLPFRGGFKLDAYQSLVKQVPGNTVAARFWGRTGCATVNGRFICQTGDCSAPLNNFGVECSGIGGQPPASLAEFTFQNGSGQHDYYDLSNVDGYTLGLKIEPLNGVSVSSAPVDQYNCGSPSCTMNLNTCPPELKMDKSGRTVCASICAAVHNAEQRARFPLLQNIYNDPDKRALVCCACLCPSWVTDCSCKNSASKYCCSPYNLPSALENGGKCRVEDWPLASTGQRYDRVFKDACPDSYSWQFDDHKSTYICGLANYRITFCP